jgi:hypothetical protein
MERFMTPHSTQKKSESSHSFVVRILFLSCQHSIEILDDEVFFIHFVIFESEFVVFVVVNDAADFDFNSNI